MAKDLQCPKFLSLSILRCGTQWSFVASSILRFEVCPSANANANSTTTNKRRGVFFLFPQTTKSLAAIGLGCGITLTVGLPLARIGSSLAKPREMKPSDVPLSYLGILVGCASQAGACAGIWSIVKKHSDHMKPVQFAAAIVFLLTTPYVVFGYTSTKFDLLRSQQEKVE